MRSTQQRVIAQGGDWFSLLLPTLLLLIPIACLSSVWRGTGSHSRAFHALEDTRKRPASDPVRISYTNGSGLCVLPCPSTVTWQSLLEKEREKPSTADEVLAMTQISQCCLQ